MFDWKLLQHEYLWITQVFVVVFGTLLLDFVQRRVLRRLIKRLEKTPNPWDDALLESLRKPLSLLIWVVGISFAAEFLSAKTSSSLLEYIDTLRNIGIVIIITWFFVRLIKNAEDNIVKSRQARGVSVDITTLNAMAKLLRLSVIITATLVMLQTLGVSISGVLAFGGVGGIAVGFAAKDLLANFFGGLMIYLDRPFSVGDWVRSPDREIEGTVENIGWRLTLIRTFDKRALYVPNSVFANIAVENPSRMLNRRIYEKIGIRYEDMHRMPDIIKKVETMLRAHSAIDSQLTLMVNFDSFAPSSLEFFIYTFTKTTVWTEFHQIKQDILFKISEIIADFGAEIAYPTSTLFIHKESTISEPYTK